MKCKIKFMRSCFGKFQLRTAVIVISLLDIVFGLYEIVSSVTHAIIGRSVMESHFLTYNGTLSVNNATTHNSISHNATTKNKRINDALYDDSSYAIIVIGCIDLFIASFLLYVTILRKYELKVAVFVASVWSFVMAFLNLVTFGIMAVLKYYWIESVFVLIVGLVELLFGYVIMSYFHFINVMVERGLDDVNMTYNADDHTVSTMAPSDIQMDNAVDERPIMDDQDDFPEFGDDGKIPLT